MSKNLLICIDISIYLPKKTQMETYFLQVEVAPIKIKYVLTLFINTQYELKT